MNPNLSKLEHLIVAMPTLLAMALDKTGNLSQHTTEVIDVLQLVFGAGYVARVMHSAIITKAIQGLQSAPDAVNKVSSIAAQVAGLSKAMGDLASQMQTQSGAPAAPSTVAAPPAQPWAAPKGGGQ